MFLQLSKNKSLLYVLSKVELDDETAKLVKENASASEIKKSLERNINSNNIVEYRKYIQKANDEAGTARASEQEDYVAPKTDLQREIAQSSERNIRSGVERDRLIREREIDFARQEISVLIDSLDDVEELLNTVTPKLENGNLELEGTTWRKIYRRFGTNPKRAEQIINKMKALERQPNFLSKKFKDILQRGKLFYGEGKDDFYDIDELQKKFRALAVKKFNVEGTTFTAVDILLYCFAKTEGYEPLSVIDRPKRRDELTIGMSALQGKLGDVELIKNRYIPKFRRAIRHLTEITAEKNLLEDRLAELKEIEDDEDKIIANKIKRLRQGINELINTERQKVKGDKDAKLQSLMAKVKDINENKEKYIQQAKVDFAKKINDEEEKLQTLIEKGEFIAQAKPSFERLQKLLNKLETEVVASKDVKRGISSALLRGVKTADLLVKLVKEFDEVEDKFKTGLKDYIESEVIELSGFGSISMGKTAEIAGLSIRFVAMYKELEEKLNIVEGMLE